MRKTNENNQSKNKACGGKNCGGKSTKNSK